MYQVGFSLESPHAGKSFRLLQSGAIDFGSGDVRAGLMAIHTLEGSSRAGYVAPSSAAAVFGHRSYSVAMEHVLYP